MQIYFWFISSNLKINFIAFKNPPFFFANLAEKIPGLFFINLIHKPESSDITG